MRTRAEFLFGGRTEDDRRLWLARLVLNGAEFAVGVTVIVTGAIGSLKLVAGGPAKA